MNRQAFTLLELLLAVALTSLVLGCLWSLWQAGVNTRDVVSRSAGQSRDLALAIEQVALRLTSTVGPAGLLAGEFVGTRGDLATSDELLFHAASDPANSAWSDVAKYELRLESQPEDQGQLVLTRTRNLLSPTEIEPEVHVLCDGVADLELEYFDGSRWLTEWDSTALGNALPSAVRVALTMDSEDARQKDDPSMRMQRVILLPVRPAAEESEQ